MTRLFLLLLLSPAALATDCRKLLDPDQNFQAYFDKLLQENSLGTEELSRFMESLDKGIIDNPISKKLARQDYQAQIHRDGFKELIARDNLDINQQKIWAKKQLEKGTYDKKRQKITKKEIEKIKEALPTLKTMVGKSRRKRSNVYQGSQ